MHLLIEIRHNILILCQTVRGIILRPKNFNCMLEIDTSSNQSLKNVGVLSSAQYNHLPCQGLTLKFQAGVPIRSFDNNSWSKTEFLVVTHTILLCTHYSYLGAYAPGTLGKSNPARCK